MLSFQDSYLVTEAWIFSLRGESWLWEVPDWKLGYAFVKRKIYYSAFWSFIGRLGYMHTSIVIAVFYVFFQILSHDRVSYCVARVSAYPCNLAC